MRARGPAGRRGGGGAGPKGARLGRVAHLDRARRDKDGEGRARHAEAEAARARRRSRSYSPIRKRRRDSPSFMEPRRITRYGGARPGRARRDLLGDALNLVQAGEVGFRGGKRAW